MDYYKEIKLLRLPKYRKEFFSRFWMRLLNILSKGVKKKLFYGKMHYCPVCRSSVRRFYNFGIAQKTLCPVCYSMDRHRLVWLFFQQETNLFNKSLKKVLHFAPEAGLMQRFKEIANLDYLSADLQGTQCMIKMDITDIPFPDKSFDVIYCSHILEHVPSDRKAMRELERILKPDGCAVIMVPIKVKITIEDPLEKSPAKRESLFGRHDHVRRYGLDFSERLKEAGFKVESFWAKQLVQNDDIDWMGLPLHAAIFYCRKGQTT